jgi:hypothetical protein
MLKKARSIFSILPGLTTRCSITRRTPVKMTHRRKMKFMEKIKCRDTRQIKVIKCKISEIKKAFCSPSFAGIEKRLFSLSNSRSWHEYKISNPEIYVRSVRDKIIIPVFIEFVSAIKAPAGASEIAKPR